jgi:HAE1 family hydrophobic/amphiphilic exporter-1
MTELTRHKLFASAFEVWRKHRAQPPPEAALQVEGQLQIFGIYAARVVAAQASLVSEVRRAHADPNAPDALEDVGIPQRPWLQVPLAPGAKPARSIAVRGKLSPEIKVGVGHASMPLGGVWGVEARGGRFSYDLRVRLLPGRRTAADDIYRLQVWNNRGELVDLSDVVTIRETPAPLVLTRRNRERAISIYANVAPGKSQTAALADVSAISRSILPAGYRTVFTGSAQTFRESFANLLFVLLLGIAVSYMVLGSQFNSYIDPVAVLLALPFSVSGALIGLWAGNQSLNIYSFIGLILLMGIVKKNSILLVDFTNQYRERGYEVREALLEACPVRLRPILMTSLATIAAALPPALALGPGAEVRIPMAIAVLGGVIFSTLLTLFVVPCAYSLFSRIERKNYEARQVKGES